MARREEKFNSDSAWWVIPSKRLLGSFPILEQSALDASRARPGSQQWTLFLYGAAAVVMALGHWRATSWDCFASDSGQTSEAYWMVSEPSSVPPPPPAGCQEKQIRFPAAVSSEEIPPDSKMGQRPELPFRSSLTDSRGKYKRQLLRSGGGNEQSELAMAKALRWLAEHQMPDGGWNFDHTLAPQCKGQCRNPGDETEARNAATGLALLPFLGANQTHRGGKYKETVRRGLTFLLSRMDRKPQGSSFYEGGRGRMYSHGICTIALCEAAALTEDHVIQKAAQEAVRFIVYAQDPQGGGWRYEPRQRGDTSVTGWQFMALHTARAAPLQIPQGPFTKAAQFLESVQTNNGANYGYTKPGAEPATTAIGLLCRMMLGWKKETPALVQGVQWL